MRRPPIPEGWARSSPGWPRSEKMCHFFSDRLSVPIAGALVNATQADPVHYSDHLSLVVVLLVRSQSANALANSVFRKTARRRHFSRQPPSWRNIRLRARELLASLTPLVVATFEATRMMPPATLDGLPVRASLTHGCAYSMRSRCAWQEPISSSLVDGQRLEAALHHPRCRRGAS